MKGHVKLVAAFVLLTLTIGSAFAGNAGASQEQTAKPLRWRGGPIQIAVSTSLTKQNPNIKYDSDVAGAVRRSMQTWQQYIDIELVETSSEKQSISPAGVRGDGVSLITIAPTAENVLFFSNGMEESAAATRVFYDKRGFITEADIALNPFQGQQFSTDGTMGTFDLESTLTHEIGHLLGLDHSDVLGATMHEKYGKNGAYGLTSYSARTLSQDDITSLQRLYGAKSDADCCVKLAGKLGAADGTQRAWQVWAEDAQSGRVRAMAVADKEGNFSFEGLSNGNVLLFAQDRNGEVAAKGELGTVTTSNSEPVSISKSIKTSKGNLKLEYLGFNGQLSDIAVSLNPGKIYTLYLGGAGLTAQGVVAGFTSPYLSVLPGTARAQDFGSEISVISVDVRVDPRTPQGDYTVYVAGEDGLKRYIVGGITVESFLNPHARASLSVD